MAVVAPRLRAWHSPAATPVSNDFNVGITGEKGQFWLTFDGQIHYGLRLYLSEFWFHLDCESQALLSGELLKFRIEVRDRIPDLNWAWKRNENELLLSLEIRALRVQSLGLGFSSITGLRTWHPQKPNYWRICILTNARGWDAKKSLKTSQRSSSTEVLCKTLGFVVGKEQELFKSRCTGHR